MMTEHEKLHAIADMTPITELLADHFEIDLEKLEDEKRAMLARLRTP
jgi:hypothetical protein